MVCMYRQNDRLYYCPMGEDLLLFHEEKQEYFRLNRTGTAIWKMFNEPRSIQDVVERLKGEFAVDENTYVGEVSQFVADLLSSSFLVAA